MAQRAQLSYRTITKELILYFELKSKHWLTHVLIMINKMHAHDTAAAASITPTVYWTRYKMDLNSEHVFHTQTCVRICQQCLPFYMHQMDLFLCVIVFGTLSLAALKILY